MNRYEQAFAKSRYVVRIPELRPHQLEALDLLTSKQAGHYARTAPTGTGKTLEMIVLALWVVTQWRRQAVLVVPSLIILDQVLRGFRRFTSLSPGVDQGKTASVPGEAVVVCTSQTFWRRCDVQPVARGYVGKYLHNAEILFDEVHACNALDSLGEAENRNLQTVLRFASVKGFSASPWSPWCLAFLEQVSIYKRTQAIRDGYAAGYTVVPLVPDQGAQLGRSLWFYDSINAAEAGKRDSGPRAATITGPAPVFGQIARFHEGHLDRLHAVGRGTVGFDSDVESVVIDRDLDSPVLAYQMAGRLRPGRRRTLYCRPGALDALLLGQRLADGAPVTCETCGASTHLTTHHRGPRSFSED